MSADRPVTLLAALKSLAATVYALCYGVVRVVLFLLAIVVDLIGAIAS